MTWAMFFQIIGIISVATGTILALSKLWSNYFERSKRMANFISSVVEKKDGKNNEKIDEKKVQRAEDLLEFIIKEEMSSIDGQMKIQRIIFTLSSREQQFLAVGISLILIGSFLQIIGLIIS
jgi:hypothetical protein